MHKFSIILTIAVVALGSALSLSVDYGIKRNADCKRLRTNQSTLMEQAETYRVRDSLNGASIRLLTLRNNEFSTHFASLGALIKDMGVRIKHVESISENATRTNYNIETAVRDSLLPTNAPPQNIQIIEYTDPHLSLRGTIHDRRFSGSIVCRDTLTQIVHRIPHRFWFVRWGTKELRQEIVSSNPHTEITYSRHIRLL